MKWDVHIYNPRTQTTHTKRAVEFPNTHRSDMSYVCFHAAKRFRSKQEYVLCMPHVEKASTSRHRRKRRRRRHR